jgi:hypothetical protein
MSKTPTSSSKRRRQRRPNVPPYTGPVDLGAQTTEVSASSPAAAGRAARLAPSAAGAAVDFRQEYGYVLRDLRNMAIVAAVMVALLVALNFIVV